MKVELSLLEKVIIPTLLPQKGNYESLCRRKLIGDKVDINKDDVKKYGLGMNQMGEIIVNEAGEAATFEIEFNEKEVEDICKGLKELQEKEEMTSYHMSLYEKFVMKKKALPTK
jgi:hypothetical protein